MSQSNESGRELPRYITAPDVRSRPRTRAAHALVTQVPVYNHTRPSPTEVGVVDPVIGALVIRPERMPHVLIDDYATVCRDLGVEPRPEGWALWFGVDASGATFTVFTRHVHPTEAALSQWREDCFSDLPVLGEDDLVDLREGWVTPCEPNPEHVDTSALDEGRPPRGSAW